MVSEKKQKLVQKLIKNIQEFPIVAVVNFENLPARQLQIMRAMLRNNGVKIHMARKRLLHMALKKSKNDNIGQLQDSIKGMPALLFTNDNPFTLYATIQKNKSPAPAKAGQTAPNDIIVKAGPTNFAPGPIISELAAVGIKTKVDGGKLTILNDTTVAKEGDEITANLAETLKRLDIQPMEVGLDLVAVWEDGTIFNAKQLHIDEDEYRQNFSTASQWAMNLAMEAAYLTEETTELLLQKAFNDAKALAMEQDILTDATAGDVLRKVEIQALALKDAAGIEVAVEPVAVEKKDEVAEEGKNEEEAAKEEEVAKEEDAKNGDEPGEDSKDEVKDEEKKEEPVEKAEESKKEAKSEEPKKEDLLDPKMTVVQAAMLKKPVSENPDDVPSAHSLIKQTMDQFGGEGGRKPVQAKVTAESLIEEEKRIAEEQKARKPTKEKLVEDTEELFEQLKKEGTLRKNDDNK